MAGKNVLIVLILVAGSLAAPLALCAQDTVEYKPISAQQLREVLEDVRSWATETVQFRNNAENLTPQEVVQQANAIRKKFDPVMVLMATTEPPPEYKTAGIVVVMGTKGIELALWHYILAVIADSQNAKNHADVILQAALGQLNDAQLLFSKLP